MQKVLGSILVVFMLLRGGMALGADQNSADPAWRSALKKAVETGELRQVMADALQSCVLPRDLIKAAIEMGHDPYQVVSNGINPGICGGGCTAGVVRGAVEAGVSRDIITKAAKETGTDPAVVERAMAAGDGPAGWRTALKHALAGKGNLKQAITDPIKASVPAGEVIKAAIEMGYDPFLATRTAIDAAGGGCLCDVVTGAMAAGVSPKLIARASGSAACCPEPEVGPVVAPPEPVKPVVRERIVLRGINFDYDKYNIKPEFQPILDEAARIIRERPNLKVVVEGHTCSMGTDIYNQRLSERRAKSVRDYLVKKSVPAAQLTVKGLGESRPIAYNATEEGKRMNRRVEFKLMQ